MTASILVELALHSPILNRADEPDQAVIENLADRTVPLVSSDVFGRFDASSYRRQSRVRQPKALGLAVLELRLCQPKNVCV